jgi:hypothetical protein
MDKRNTNLLSSQRDRVQVNFRILCKTEAYCDMGAHNPFTLGDGGGPSILIMLGVLLGWALTRGPVWLQKHQLSGA